MHQEEKQQLEDKIANLEKEVASLKQKQTASLVIIQFWKNNNKRNQDKHKIEQENTLREKNAEIARVAEEQAAAAADLKLLGPVQHVLVLGNGKIIQSNILLERLTTSMRSEDGKGLMEAYNFLQNRLDREHSAGWCDWLQQYVTAFEKFQLLSVNASFHFMYMYTKEVQKKTNVVVEALDKIEDKRQSTLGYAMTVPECKAVTYALGAWQDDESDNSHPDCKFGHLLVLAFGHVGKYFSFYRIAYIYSIFNIFSNYSSYTCALFFHVLILSSINICAHQAASISAVWNIHILSLNHF